MDKLTEPIAIETGSIIGELKGEPGKPIRVFKGIPYAAPPIGELRWRPPQPTIAWDGIRECIAYSAIAPQSNPTTGEAVNPKASEDCLFLNVLTPAGDDDRLPVMIWFHGGGLQFGTANTDLYNSIALASHGVVLVTVNHRLGVMGLLSHPLLTAESGNGASGNQSYMDLLASLQWVHDNIAAFGGNPDNVTIFGESGGGGKVHAMMISPLARGLFHRAIIESGTGPISGRRIGSSTPLQKAEEQGEQIFAKLGVKTLEEARTIPWQDVIAKNTLRRFPPTPSDFRAMPIGWAVDGFVFPDKPETILQEARHNPVPVIVGANLGELSVLGRIAGEISFYEALLKANAKTQMQSYAYVFNQVPAGWATKGVKDMGHALEIPYVFGCGRIASNWREWLEV